MVIADSYTTSSSSSLATLTATSFGARLSQNTSPPISPPDVYAGRGTFNAYNSNGTYLNGTWFGSATSSGCSFEASAEFG